MPPASCAPVHSLRLLLPAPERISPENYNLWVSGQQACETEHLRDHSYRRNRYRSYKDDSCNLPSGSLRDRFGIAPYATLKGLSQKATPFAWLGPVPIALGRIPQWLQTVLSDLTTARNCSRCGCGPQTSAPRQIPGGMVRQGATRHQWRSAVLSRLADPDRSAANPDCCG